MYLSTGTFRSRVWVCLISAAPWGRTLSYKGLAEAAGNGKAAQAVGQAVASNPLMLLVPCHRVIRSDGGAGNYAHGRRNAVKAWLLNFEQGGGAVRTGKR